MAKKYKGFKGSSQAIEACHNKPKMSRKQQDAMLKAYAMALMAKCYVEGGIKRDFS